MEASVSIGVDLIGIVKTNTKGFFKATIEGLTKDWPGGSYIVLSSNNMVPGERPLIEIGYKYNYQNILSFVATVGAGRTMLGINYLLTFPDQFSNISICPVARPHLMSKFFGLVNEVESHNKSRKSDIVMDKFWVKQCGWLWLCTTVAMGIKMTNCWKLFRYGIKGKHYENFIGIREFSEQSAMDCFSNPFTAYIGTPEKNIPSLDYIDNKGSFSNCWILNCSRSSPHNS